jgi:transposase-like protein
LFTWRKLATQGALTATAAEEDLVPASEYRALQNQVKELQRLLGKKTMKGEILKEALEIATGPKNICCLAVIAEGKFPMTAVCETFDVARSNMVQRVRQRPSKARARPPLADDDLVDEIKEIISEMPTYGYRRVHAIVKPAAKVARGRTPNASIGS